VTSNIDKIKKIANHLKVLHGGKHVSEEERLRLKKQAEEQPRDELGRFIATDPRAQWQDEQPIVSGEEKELPSQSASSLEEIERELGLRKSDSKSVAEEIKKQAGHQILEHGQVPASIPAAASEVDLLKHYKRNNHSKDATLLRYLVHRIENVDQYQTSQGGKDADADFMKRSGEALNLAHREARHFEEQPTIHQLHHFTRQHPHVIQGLIDQQKKLHDHLQSKQSQVASGLSSQQYIKNINGEPHIALNRGLKRGVRKPDPSIASYSDSKESLGGRCEVHHPHWVPLKNVWYSYDLGPKEAHPQRYFPAQDEYIVSPHELKSASAHDVKKLIPAKQPKMERKVASESLCAESLAKESSFLSATKGTFAHPTKAVKTATQPNAPKDIPHIRADSQTEVNFKLEKAFSAKHWNPIDRANYQNGQNIIDFAGQSAMTNPADKEYVDAATKPEIEPVVNQNFMLKGISPKIIHNTGDKTTSYMTKPYYRAPDEGGNSHLPIMGWATATNHALYQAGNIGNLCEKIQTHVHNGTPVTVHPFERDYQDAGSIDRYHMPSRLPVHLHLPYQQIAMMDFLTHNTDRHSGNFMVKKGRTQLGQDHKQDLTPLAIDHERSFQYLDRQLSHPADSIMKLLQHTMGAYDNAKATVSGMDMKPLAQWWNTNKDRIIDTFHKHAAHIKHDSVRKHVTDHFMARAGMLNDWARHDKSHTLYDGRDLTYEMDMGDDNEFKFKGVFKEKKKRPTKAAGHWINDAIEADQVLGSMRIKNPDEFQGNPVRPLKERKMKVAGLLEKKPVVDKVKKKPAVDKKVKKA